MSRDIDVSVTVSLDDMLSEMGRYELVELVEDLIDDGYVPGSWHRTDECHEARLGDPVTLLNTIVELRLLGYTVEPGV